MGWLNGNKKKMEKWKNFATFSLALALFFVLEYFHEWANNFTINLHFCSHTYCMIFSVIFFGFTFFAWQKKKSYLNMALVVLVVGIVLMNMTYCVNGDIFFTDQFSILKTNESILVPIPPCMETDDGKDFITFGSIRSGADVDDLCMGTDKLRERYCDTELTYTSVDISCSARYGVLWYCTEGECREGEADADEDEEEEGEEVSETTLILCSDGIDNDLDGLIDCYDTDCYIICGDFDYSCQHISPYPTCGGTCPIGEECIAYYVYDGTPDGGWCECMPSGNTACGDSFPTCGGWCLNGEICVADNFGCYCEFDYIGDCSESDEGNYPLINGDCIDTIGGRYVDYCWQDKFQTTLYEYYCLGGECVPLEYNCADFGLSCVDVWDSGSYCGTGEL